ncbi:hypothetical protein LH51_13285 [Nitrincola sp. A-D6]|uniref:hypothetical protein n=1 Tax=Nitrincola sp. A-D6 TaxID=1545442 RepID=UPI00051FB3AB|nr:hypothetical protein [Nitrincola sp. A-D6]KGK41656.1 hypothetical protein LH51_13285 [Nitrincola sp. A-D6]
MTDLCTDPATCARLEVRDLLQTSTGTLAATGQGIYRLDPSAAVALKHWDGMDVQALGPAHNAGFVAVVGDHNGYRIAIADTTCSPLHELPQPSGLSARRFTRAMTGYWLAENMVSTVTMVRLATLLAHR